MYFSVCYVQGTKVEKLCLNGFTLYKYICNKEIYDRGLSMVMFNILPSLRSSHDPGLCKIALLLRTLHEPLRLTVCLSPCTLQEPRLCYD